MAQRGQEPEDDLGHISQLARGAALRFWAMTSAAQQQVLGVWVLMVFYSLGLQSFPSHFNSLRPSFSQRGK